MEDCDGNIQTHPLHSPRQMSNCIDQATQLSVHWENVYYGLYTRIYPPMLSTCRRKNRHGKQIFRREKAYRWMEGVINLLLTSKKVNMGT